MYVCVYVSICATEKFIKGAENYVVERLFNDQKKKDQIIIMKENKSYKQNCSKTE